MTVSHGSRSLAFDHALEEYADVYLASRNLAPRTRREYSNDLKSLIAFLVDGCALHSPTQVLKTHLDGYFAHLDGKGYSGAARRRQYSSIRSFFLFLLELGAIDIDPTKKLIPPEREYKEPRVLTEGEYKRLQLVVSQDPSFSAKRDIALIELLLQTGLRLSEAARLSTASIELPAKIAKDGPPGSVHVLGKGRKDRTLTLNWKACRTLKEYLSIRPDVEDPALFLSKFKAGMSPRAVERTVAKHLDAAHIPNASVHTLRHTFATHHVKNGTNLNTVKDMLGHASLDTTTIYVNLAREVMDKEIQANAL
jgi:site-specific recombinase XerD